MTVPHEAVPAHTGRHRPSGLSGWPLLERITHELIAVDHLKAIADRETTARAVVAYIEAAAADLDDARTLLEQHLRGL